MYGEAREVLVSASPAAVSALPCRYSIRIRIPPAIEPESMERMFHGWGTLGSPLGTLAACSATSLQARTRLVRLL